MLNPALLSQAKLKQIRKLKSRKYRVLEKLYLCEGYRLFTAAFNSGAEIIDIVVSDNFLNHDNYRQMTKALEKSSLSIYRCSEKQMREISDDVTPPGLLFLVKYDFKNESHLEQCIENKVIYLENISDPGNLGAIIRTALWFDMNSLILSPNCVDPTNPKVVRASAGAIFYADIYLNIESELVFSKFKSRNFNFAASTASGNISIADWHPPKKCMLFLGSEANGLSAEIIDKCDNQIKIPGNNKIESLNLAVAGGIFISQLANTK
jgi:RNA methyltransferase, TrmH family